MKTGRRGFLGALIGGMASAMTLDLDKELWVPGERVISIPPVLTIERQSMPDMVISELADSRIALAAPRIHLGSVHLSGSLDSFFWLGESSGKTVADVQNQINEAANLGGRVITADVKLPGGKRKVLRAEPDYSKMPRNDKLRHLRPLMVDGAIR